MQNSDTTYVIVSAEKFTRCIVVHSESNLVLLTNWLARVLCLSKLDSPQTSFGRSQIIVPRVLSDHFKLKILDNEYLLSCSRSKHTYFEHIIKNKESFAGNWEKCSFKNILCDSFRTFLYCSLVSILWPSWCAQTITVTICQAALSPKPIYSAVKLQQLHTKKERKWQQGIVGANIYMVQSIGTVGVWMVRVLTVAL